MQPSRAPTRITVRQTPVVEPPPAVPLVAFQLSCDEAPLGPGLGPPDYNPPQWNAPEEALDASSLASGYRWSAESLHISEAHEHLLSLTCHTTYWEPHNSAALKQVLHDRLAAVARKQAARQQVMPPAGQPLGAAAAGTAWNVLQPRPSPFPHFDSPESVTSGPSGVSLTPAVAAWVKDLTTSQPLEAAISGAGVPAGLPAEQLVNVMVDYRVPLPRAVWLAKVVLWSARQSPMKQPPPAAAGAAASGVASTSTASAAGGAATTAGSSSSKGRACAQDWTSQLASSIAAAAPGAAAAAAALWQVSQVTSSSLPAFSPASGPAFSPFSPAASPLPDFTRSPSASLSSSMVGGVPLLSLTKTMSGAGESLNRELSGRASGGGSLSVPGDSTAGSLGGASVFLPDLRSDPGASAQSALTVAPGSSAGQPPAAVQEPRAALSRWQYVLKLAGYSLGQGLGDPAVLLSWAVQQLTNCRTSLQAAPLGSAAAAAAAATYAASPPLPGADNSNMLRGIDSAAAAALAAAAAGAHAGGALLCAAAALHLVDLTMQEVCTSPTASLQLLRSLLDLHSALAQQQQQQQQQQEAATTPFSVVRPAAHTTGTSSSSNWRHVMVNARLTGQQLQAAVHGCLAGVVLAAPAALVTAGGVLEQVEAALCSSTAAGGPVSSLGAAMGATSNSNSSSWAAGMSTSAAASAATPAAALEVLQQARQRCSCLAAAVCPRRLQQSSSAAFMALDAAAGVGDVGTGVAVALAAAGDNWGRVVLSVALVCDWALSTPAAAAARLPVTALPSTYRTNSTSSSCDGGEGSAAALETALPLPADTSAQQLFAARLLWALCSRLQQHVLACDPSSPTAAAAAGSSGAVTGAEQQHWPQGRRISVACSQLLLQPALTCWLSGHVTAESPTCAEVDWSKVVAGGPQQLLTSYCCCGGTSCSSSGVGSGSISGNPDVADLPKGQLQAVGSLLLLLVEVGLFSPAQYLQMLTAQGVLRGRYGQRHRRLLQLLHPKLPCLAVLGQGHWQVVHNSMPQAQPQQQQQQQEEEEVTPSVSLSAPPSATTTSIGGDCMLGLGRPSGATLAHLWSGKLTPQQLLQPSVAAAVGPGPAWGSTTTTSATSSSRMWSPPHRAYATAWKAMLRAGDTSGDGGCGARGYCNTTGPAAAAAAPPPPPVAAAALDATGASCSSSRQRVCLQAVAAAAGRLLGLNHLQQPLLPSAAASATAGAYRKRGRGAADSSAAATGVEGDLGAAVRMTDMQQDDDVWSVLPGGSRLGTDMRPMKVQHTNGTASPAAAAAAAGGGGGGTHLQQLPGSRDLSHPPGDPLSSFPGLLAAVAVLRPWERAALAATCLQWVAAAWGGGGSLRQQMGQAQQQQQQQQVVKDAGTAVDIDQAPPVEKSTHDGFDQGQQVLTTPEEQLLRVVALLLAAGAASNACLLLLQLLHSQVQGPSAPIRQQQQVVQGTTAAGCASLPSLSCICSCLEACLGHLAAAGLLPVLLEASCAPLWTTSQTRSATAAGVGKVSQGAARAVLGRVLELVTHVLQGHMGDPSVAAWWELVNTPASSGDADTPGQHWLLSDLQRAAAVSAPTPASRPSPASAAAAGGGGGHGASARTNSNGSSSSSIKGIGRRPLPGLVTADQVKRAWSTLTTSGDWAPLQQLPPAGAAAVQQVLAGQRAGSATAAETAAAAAALREVLLHPDVAGGAPVPARLPHLLLALLASAAQTLTSSAPPAASAAAGAASQQQPQHQAAAVAQLLRCLQQELAAAAAAGPQVKVSTAAGGGLGEGLRPALLAVASALLQDPAPAGAPTLTAAQRHQLLVTVVTAASYGLLRLTDLVTHLLMQPPAGPLPPAVAAHVLLVLLGPGAGGSTGQSQVLGTGVNPGTLWWLQQQQMRLGPTQAAAAVADVLLAAVLCGLQQEGAVLPSVNTWVDLVNDQREVNPCTLAVNTAAALSSHGPLRSCLLSDLQAVAGVLLKRRGSTLVKALPGKLTPWALPQRLAVQGLISGRLHVLSPDRVVVLQSPAEVTDAAAAAAAAAMALTRTGGSSSAVASASGVVSHAVLGSGVAVRAAAAAMSQHSSQAAAAAASAGGGVEAGAAAAAAAGQVLSSPTPPPAPLKPPPPAAAAADQVYQAGWLLGVVNLLGGTTPRVLPAVQAVLDLMVREQQYKAAVQATGGSAWIKALEAAAVPSTPTGANGSSSSTPGNAAAAPAEWAVPPTQVKPLVDCLLTAAVAAAGSGTTSSSNGGGVGACSSVGGDIGQLSLALGPAVSEELLQRLASLFQDKEGRALAGLAPTAAALADLPPARALLAAVAAGNAAGAPAAAQGGPQHRQGQQQQQQPFAVEAALADMALVLLSRSSPLRQRQLAGDLVKQLTRLAEAVEQLPSPGPGGCAAPATAAVGVDPGPGQPMVFDLTGVPVKAAEAAGGGSRRSSEAAAGSNSGVPGASPRASVPPSLPASRAASPGVSGVSGVSAASPTGPLSPTSGPGPGLPPRPDAPPPPPPPSSVGGGGGGSAAAAGGGGGGGGAAAGGPRQRRFGGGLAAARSRAQDGTTDSAAGSGPAATGGTVKGGAAAGTTPAAPPPEPVVPLTALGPPAAVQVAVAVRLRVLMPLLPVVRVAYSSSDSESNLRGQLATALLQLLTSPWLLPVHSHGQGSGAGGSTVSQQQAAAAATVQTPAAALGQEDPAATQPVAQPAPPAAAAAAAGGGAPLPSSTPAAAAGAFGSPLWEALADVWLALVGGEWPAWLKGGHTRLREVPPWEGLTAAQQLVAVQMLEGQLDARLGQQLLCRCPGGAGGLPALVVVPPPAAATLGGENTGAATEPDGHTAMHHPQQQQHVVSPVTAWAAWLPLACIKPGTFSSTASRSRFSRPADPEQAAAAGAAGGFAAYLAGLGRGGSPEEDAAAWAAAAASGGASEGAVAAGGAGTGAGGESAAVHRSSAGGGVALPPTAAAPGGSSERPPGGPAAAGGGAEGGAAPSGSATQAPGSGGGSRCLQCLATGRPPPSPGAACPHGVVGSGGGGAAGAAGRGPSTGQQQQVGGATGSGVLLPAVLEGAVAAAGRWVEAAEGAGGVAALVAGGVVAPVYEPSYAGGGL